jgi:GTP cyclohydrolase I
MAMEMVEEIIEAVVGEDEKVEEKAEVNTVEQQKVLTDLYGKLIHELGEDLDRPGLLKTPERAAKAMLFFTKGYNESLEGK